MIVPNQLYSLLLYLYENKNGKSDDLYALKEGILNYEENNKCLYKYANNFIQVRRE